MTGLQAVTGGCHCGAVRFEAEVDLGKTMACNCSHCEKKGFILTFTPIERFRLLAGEEKLTEYRFHRHQIAHRFCAACGVQAFGFGSGPDGKADGGDQCAQRRRHRSRRAGAAEFDGGSL